MFTKWLMAQMERDDTVGRCARMCWDDYNSGCAGHFEKAGHWKKHFETRHVDTINSIMELLGPTFEEYLDSLTPPRDSN